MAAAFCVLLSMLAILAWPNPPQARANVPCSVGTAPIGAVTGAVGLGNPVGDACDKVSGAVEAAAGGAVGKLASPVTGALKGLGNDVFEQLTSWVSEGASWLMGQVVKAIDSSTTPRLDTEGFLAAYGRMAAIAAVMACAMLLLAVLEGIAQGSPGLLARVVLVNVPLAFLGTSLAFVVVQLLLGVTDGLSAAIADASHHDSTRFFEAAIGDLGHIGAQPGAHVKEAGGGIPAAAGTAGEAEGAVAVPLFVGFIAAIVGAFAAFFVWLELVMRDAAIYAVSLFMPLALAASIWPRWTGALRRTGELLVAVIGSKFVIVAIVSLAASLVAEEGGSVEHVLAAAALMCLACFAPFVLLRLIPFSEGAMAAAYGRRSAAGGAVSAVQIGSDVQILRNMGRSSEGSGVSLWNAAEGGGGKGGGGGGSAGGALKAPGGPGGPGTSGGGPAGSAAAGGGSGAGGAPAGAVARAEGGPAAAAAVPVAAARGAKGAAGRLSQTATTQQGGGSEDGTGGSTGSGSAERGSQGPTPSPGGPSSPLRPRPETPSEARAPEAGDPPRAPGERPPRPVGDSPAPRDGGGEGGNGGAS
ncbi:MAG TPA: hypothetical protein VHA80_03370 [Solirubrobacterales bacterium]|nr:hypothetical protein [Solirubrobacterales bacterium]